MTSLLRLPEVERRTGLSRSEIYKRMSAGEFPRAVKISKRFSGWVEDEIERWLIEKIAERDSEGAAA